VKRNEPENSARFANRLNDNKWQTLRSKPLFMKMDEKEYKVWWFEAECGMLRNKPGEEIEKYKK
jgi:hypothetical protein